MASDFLNWMSEHVLEEAVSRRAQMAYDDPAAGTKEVVKPKKGDWFIASPRKFFSGNNRHLPDPSTMHRVLNTDNEGNVFYIQQNPPKGRTPKPQSIPLEDLNDGSFKYSDHAGTGEKLWVKIPASNQALQSKFQKHYDKFQQAEQERKANLDSEDQAAKAAEIDLKSSLADDPDEKAKIARRASLDIADQERAKNFQLQQKGLLKTQVDADDHPAYVAKVAPKPMAAPAGDLDQRINAFKQKTSLAAPAADDDALWNQLVAAKAGTTPAGDADSKWQQAIAGQQPLQMSPRSDELSPFAARKTPMPLTKAESVRFHGDHLIGEAMRNGYEYF
jgi:hypothetical protein